MTWRSPTPAAAVSSAPDLLLGLAFLLTWAAPTALGVTYVREFLLVMLLEFIVVHSAGFMGMAALRRASRRARTRTILAFALFYTLFVAAWSVAFGTWWPLVAFWVLTLNRLLPVILNQVPEADEARLLQRGWAVGALFYLFAVMITTVLPLPALGITDSVVQDASLPGGGLWIDEPWRVLAAGAVYFLCVGLSGLWDHRMVPDSSLPSLKGRRKT